MTGDAAASDASDRAYMARAVELATQGPIADPNPRVGAVLVADGVVIGEGFHRGAGTDHAEVAALSAAGSAVRSSTAYVTLEPCTHYGRTGPCAEALLAAGVARVVIGTRDPHRAASGGADLLRANGVRVDVMHDVDAELLNRRWSHAVTHGRPFVTWKAAATLDGRVAAADGSSRWITGEPARAEVHRLRAECDAIAVGTGTVLADDPALTVRDQDGSPSGRQPLRVVLGARDVPEEAAIRTTDHWFQVRERDPMVALTALHERQIRHLLLEGGPSVAAAWLRAGVVDEVVTYVAPVLLGSGAGMVGDLGVTALSDAHRLNLVDVTRVGDDVRLLLRSSRSNPVAPEGDSPCSPA